jgi:hypothetical protein
VALQLIRTLNVKRSLIGDTIFLKLKINEINFATIVKEMIIKERTVRSKSFVDFAIRKVIRKMNVVRRIVADTPPR